MEEKMKHRNFNITVATVIIQIGIFFGAFVYAEGRSETTSQRTMGEEYKYKVKQVEVEIWFLSFEHKEIEQLARKDQLNGPSLLTMFKQGKGHLMAASKVVTPSGLNAISEHVKEIRYSTGKGHFETRATGVILNVTPTISSNSKIIELTMSPEWCKLPEWTNHDITSPDGVIQTSRQPIFFSRNVSTSIAVNSGKMVLISGATLETSEAEPAVYLFVKATALDGNHEPIKSTEDSKK